MAHFAELDENNIVVRVIVVDNNVLLDGYGKESEVIGIDFCKSLFGQDTTWIQTSYNGTMRKNYAGIGFTYDKTRNAFIPPAPEGEGWTFDEDLCKWRNIAQETAQQQVATGVTRV